MTLSDHALRAVLNVIRSVCPAVLLLVFLVTFVARSIVLAKQLREAKARSTLGETGSKSRSRPASATGVLPNNDELLDFSPARKAFFIIGQILLISSYLINGTIVAWHALAQRQDDYWCGQAYVIYILGSCLIHALIFINLIDTKPAPTFLHAITWWATLFFNILLLYFSSKLYSSVHREGKAFDPDGGRLLHGFSGWETLGTFVDVLRIVLLLLLISFYHLFIIIHFLQIRARPQAENGAVDATTSLLKSHNGHDNGYLGTQISIRGNAVRNQGEHDGWTRPKKLPSVTWWQYIASYALFFKYIWPSNSSRLKTIFSFCVALLFAGRIVNILVPIQAGRVTDMLASKSDGGRPSIPFGAITLFILLRLLQGSSGLLNSLRQVLWIPIGQYSYRELAVAIFKHVHTLSLDFHINKSGGELLSAMSKGGSINTFLDQITFQVAPMFLDLCLAMGYFFWAFDVYYAMIVATVSLAYFYLTIRLAQWRADVKRQVTNLDRLEEAVKMDSIGLYETVKYFNAEKFENERYRDVVERYQGKQYILNASLCLMNVSQNVCFTFGLMVTCFLAAFQISIGQRQVGKFVALLTYMAQLQQPLNFFGTFYRSIQNSMINSERILELFKEKPTVMDKTSATHMTECKGGIRFKDVKFAYDSRRAALTGLDFECRPGTRTALVGASGVGKSTVFRLLFRFYNIVDGSIEVDGIDVEDITVQSLRSFIGVVPQETPLFNDTIMFNLRYAKPDAKDEEVYKACQAASIHDKILDFPDGYNSTVGEKGIKLSGGERQRIAIARTILKDPRILLLDEATASLDSETEQKIQDSIMRISEGRTSLVIAHRLSTIINSDQILVMADGQVVERGTHEELLALNQRYTKMWERHVKAERAELQALALHKKAERLSKRNKSDLTGDSSAHQSDDEERETPVRAASQLSLQMTGFSQEPGYKPVHS